MTSKPIKELIKTKIAQYDRVVNENKSLVNELARMEDQVKRLVDLYNLENNFNSISKQNDSIEQTINNLNENYKKLSISLEEKSLEVSQLRVEKKEIVSQSEGLNKEIQLLQELLQKENMEKKKLEDDVVELMGMPINVFNNTHSVDRLKLIDNKDENQ